MARPLRIEYPGAVYHVTSRGNEKKAIFRDDQDKDTFLKTLHKVNDRYNWLCHAYCLMDNHYHLLIETPDANLSIGMRQLNGVYTQTYNRRHTRVGHLFQGRYKAILIQKESHLLEVSRYIVLNPVRAGIVEMPEEWKWSSYSSTAGREKAHLCLNRGWILSQFYDRKEYRKFVNAGIGAESIWKGVKAQNLLGEEGFIDELIDYIKGEKDVSDIPKNQRYINRPKLDKVFTKNILKDKQKRNEKIGEAVERYGYSQREVADYLGMHFTSISRIMNEK